MSQGSAARPDSSAGPGTSKKRRLAETDVDPSGDLSSTQTGETEDPGSGRGADNQPAENRETPGRSGEPAGGNRDTENAPKPGHEE